MKILRKICRFVRGHQRAAAVGFALMAGANAVNADIQLGVLQTRTDIFTNVTVYGKSDTDLFIRHARGIGNVKIKDLDQNALVSLGMAEAPSNAAASSQTSGSAKKDEKPSNSGLKAGSSSMSNLDAKFREIVMPNLALLSTLSPVRLNSTVLLAAIGLLLCVYLFVCYCLKLICEKTGNEPGLMVWLPILQMFPMLRAAGMSGLWFLAFLIPVLNLVAQIVWCFKIVQARGKSVWVAIGLLLPLTNLIAFLYLAFSNAGESEKPEQPEPAPLGPLLAEA